MIATESFIMIPPFKNIEFFLTDQDMDIIQLPEINDNATFLRNAQEMLTTGLCVLDLLLVRGSELQIVRLHTYHLCIL